jgi:hypothetical protein
MVPLPAVLHRAQDGAAWRRRFQRGVSLHGHTCHSRESLDFIPRYARQIPFVSQWLDGEVGRYRRTTGRQIRFERGFWTGPLDPQQAWRLEKTQIQALDLEAMVSLTDHDDIAAAGEIPEAPVSCEWTVPFRGAILHLGIHNLPRESAAAWLSAMKAFTVQPEEATLGELLAAFHAMPATLVVLNHPLWALNGDALRHCVAMLDFLRQFRQFLHALEWSGIRPDHENAEAFRLARELEMPVVSGGDRHGCEPNSVLNVTAESTFEAFIAEVRDGHGSHILLMPQYDRCLRTRLMETMWDVLRDNPGNHRRSCFDRIYYPGEDGAAQPISAFWQAGPPQIIRAFLGVMKTLESPTMRPVLRAAFGSHQDQGD